VVIAYRRFIGSFEEVLDSFAVRTVEELELTDTVLVRLRFARRCTFSHVGVVSPTGLDLKGVLLIRSRRHSRTQARVSRKYHYGLAVRAGRIARLCWVMAGRSLPRVCHNGTFGSMRVASAYRARPTQQRSCRLRRDSPWIRCCDHVAALSRTWRRS